MDWGLRLGELNIRIQNSGLGLGFGIRFGNWNEEGGFEIRIEELDWGFGLGNEIGNLGVSIGDWILRIRIGIMDQDPGLGLGIRIEIGDGDWKL